jgi:hypothetical protein
MREGGSQECSAAKLQEITPGEHGTIEPQLGAGEKR